MSWNSLEKGWGGYSTFRPMRNAEVDEESIDVEEEWEEPESLEGMDPEEAFGYGWVKAAEMMQERLDELMALPDEEDVEDLAKTAKRRRRAAAKIPQSENFAYTIPVEDRGNSSEEIFLKEPRYYETREFAESKVLGNDPSIDKGDQATGKPVPPTPSEIIKTTPGSKELSTFSRYLIQTDYDIKGVPEHRDDVEKHPDLVQEQDEEAEASKKTASLMDEFKRVKGLAEKLPDNDFLTSVLKQISEGHNISPKQEEVIEKIKGQVGEMTKMQEQLKTMKHKQAFAGWTLTKFIQKS